MTGDTGRLILRQEPSMSANTSAYWEVTDRRPSTDALMWFTRYRNLMLLQPYLESAINALAPPTDGDLSTAFAELLDGMALISDSNSGPDLQWMQMETMMIMFQDIGLVSRAFTVEIGLKTVLKLCGTNFPNRHFLLQLFDLLPNIARNQLDYAHRILGKPENFPDKVIYIPSVREVFSQFDNIYTDIRYRPQIVDNGPILSAWYNLEAASHSLLFTICTHKSNLDMRHAAMADIEPDSAVP